MHQRTLLYLSCLRRAIAAESLRRASPPEEGVLTERNCGASPYGCGASPYGEQFLRRKEQVLLPAEQSLRRNCGARGRRVYLFLNILKITA